MGWQILREVLLGAAATCALTSCLADKPAVAAPTPPTPQPEISRPSKPKRKPGGKRLSIEGDDSSQCYVPLTANAADFSGLIDTGSHALVFGRNDARKLGFNPDRLSYDQPYWSAHGTGYEAAVTLRELSLDGVVVGRNVPAKIVETTMDHPLLGASVLKGMHLVYAEGNCVLSFNGNGGAGGSAAKTG